LDNLKSCTRVSCAERYYANDGNTDVVNQLRSLRVGATQSLLDLGTGNGANAAAALMMGYAVHGLTLSAREGQEPGQSHQRITMYFWTRH
jgi:cyclopropane fatty-acyl-phospholipid synthase-like methyltransferase